MMGGEGGRCWSLSVHKEGKKAREKSKRTDDKVDDDCNSFLHSLPSSLSLSLSLSLSPLSLSQRLKLLRVRALRESPGVPRPAHVVAVRDWVLHQKGPPPDRNRGGGGQSQPAPSDELGASHDEEARGDDGVGSAPDGLLGPDVFL